MSVKEICKPSTGNTGKMAISRFVVQDKALRSAAALVLKKHTGNSGHGGMALLQEGEYLHRVPKNVDEKICYSRPHQIHDILCGR